MGMRITLSPWIEFWKNYDIFIYLLDTILYHLQKRTNKFFQFINVVSKLTLEHHVSKTVFYSGFEKCYDMKLMQYFEFFA